MAQPKDYTATRITWSPTGDAFFPFAAVVEGEQWQVRVNDWPDEPTVFTLIVGGRPVLDFDDWPKAWKKPRSRP